MVMDLNTLIESSQVEGLVVGTIHSLEQAPTTHPKQILPEPGEPELIAPPASVVAGNFRRRQIQRWEAMNRRLAYARALVSNGWNEEKALYAAGYTTLPGAVRGAVQSLNNHPEVISEISRLRAILEQKADVATIDLAKEWVAIASSNVFDAFTEVLGVDGETRSLHLKSKAEIPKAVQRTIKSVKIKRWRQIQKDGSAIETENIEVSLWDKQAALDSLAKIQGLYADKTADAIDGLAMKIAQRTEKYRKKIGVTYEQDPISGTG